MKITLIPLILALLFYSCATLKNLADSNLTSDYYKIHEQSREQEIYLQVSEDSLTMFSEGHPQKQLGNVTNGQIFLKKGFDVDVMTVPFKFRPATENLPRQLTVDFNGNIFLGYRLDRYKMIFVDTPAGLVKKVRHRAITIGAFGGIGTSSITPWTTNYGTTEEYNGFILNRGISLMGGVNNLTVGIGVGWDYLTDRDKDVWIYQNEPWFGLTLSLNLN